MDIIKFFYLCEGKNKLTSPFFKCKDYAIWFCLDLYFKISIIIISDYKCIQTSLPTGKNANDKVILIRKYIILEIIID